MSADPVRRDGPVQRSDRQKAALWACKTSILIRSGARHEDGDDAVQRRRSAVKEGSTLMKTLKVCLIFAVALGVVGCSGLPAATPVACGSGVTTLNCVPTVNGQRIEATGSPTPEITITPTESPSATPSTIDSASPTPKPEATATPEMALAPENQVLIDTWMKGKGIPSGGFVDMHTLKPLNFGFISEDPPANTNIQDYFQGEIITGQPIDNNYYVFEGFIKNGVRCWAAFDAGPIDPLNSNAFNSETLAGGNQWLGGGEIARNRLTTVQLTEIMPQLTGQANVVVLSKKEVGNHTGFETLIAWINKHIKADQAFTAFLKGSGQPSFINAIPKAGDNPNAYPELSEFYLPLAGAIQP